MSTITYWPAVSSGGDSGDGWFDDQVDLIQSLVPQLDAVKDIPLGITPTGTTLALAFGANTDPDVEGGGITAAGSTVICFTATVSLTPKTGKLAFFAQAKFAAPSADTCAFGLVNAAGTRTVYFGTSAGSATKFVLSGAAAAATTAAADTLWHDFLAISDGTTWSLYIDGVASGATFAASALNSDEAQTLFLLNTTTKGAIVSRCGYAYVTPT